MKKFVKVITFKEFKDSLHEEGYILPLNSGNMSDAELGVILNKTFVPIDFSFDAEQVLKH